MGYHQLLWITKTNQSFDTALYFNIGVFAGILASKIKLKGYMRIKGIIVLSIVLLVILEMIRLIFTIDKTTLFAYLGLTSGILIYVCTKKAFIGLEPKNHNKRYQK